MRNDNDVVVRVHESWSGWRSAGVRVADLQDVHWARPRGAPHAMIHGWAWCTHVQGGDLSHDCDPASMPHRIQVCVLKHHAIPTTYAALADRAGAAGEAPSHPPIAAGTRTAVHARA
jgi:hypothetical protein